MCENDPNPTFRLQRLHKKWSLIQSVGILFGERWRGPDVHGRPSVGVGIVLWSGTFNIRQHCVWANSVLCSVQGATSSNLCHPGMMCKLDCQWLSLYLFVCLGGWPVGILAQPDLANIRGFCWELGGSHPALFREIDDCFPYKIAPVMCPDLAPEFIPGFACHPSDLVTRFGGIICI